jgi:hypothetical protein
MIRAFGAEVIEFLVTFIAKLSVKRSITPYIL